MFGVFLFVTYYLQDTLHYSPVITGVAFLPMVACIALASNLSSASITTTVRISLPPRRRGGWEQIWISTEDGAMARNSPWKSVSVRSPRRMECLS